MSEIPSSQLLTPLEAAHHLGITPELLFCYTKSQLRKSHANPRRLGTIEIDGKTRFNRVELDDFDRYLSEPWAIDEGSPRKNPPKSVVDHLRAESATSAPVAEAGLAYKPRTSSHGQRAGRTITTTSSGSAQVVTSSMTSTTAFQAINSKR